MYGTRSHAAGFEIRAKAKMVSKILMANKMISAKATPGDWKPKKIIDHQKFKNNWTANKMIAIVFNSRGALLFQINQSEIPISR